MFIDHAWMTSMWKGTLFRQSMFYVTLLISCFLGLPVWAQDYWVIVNKNNSLTELSQKEVKAIFLGVQRVFHQGNEIDVVDQAIENPIYAEFYKYVADKTVAQVRAKRASLTFTGDLLPPDAVFDDEAVVAWIEKHPQGIGYIYANSVEPFSDRAKVVFRFSVKEPKNKQN